MLLKWTVLVIRGANSLHQIYCPDSELLWEAARRRSAQFNHTPLRRLLNYCCEYKSSYFFNNQSDNHDKASEALVHT